MRNLKILFIGGSNLVINNGIRVQLVQTLESAGFLVDAVQNLAVGGAGSIFGLENLIRQNELIDSNLVVVEYGINDWGTYKTDPNLWRTGFFQLLKEIRCRYPNSYIFNILLGRRDLRFWKIQEKLHQEMRVIAKEFGAFNIEVDATFKALSTESSLFESNYRDDAHLIHPRATHHAALIASNEITGTWLRKEITRLDKLVKYEAGEEKLRIFEIGEPDLEFKNSQFKRIAKKLSFGDSIWIKLPDAPHVLSFISTRESGSLLIEFVNKKIIINTCIADAPSKLDFVIKHTPIEGVYGSLENVGEYPVTVRITAISSQHPSWDDSIVQKVWAVKESGISSPDAYLLTIGTSTSK